LVEKAQRKQQREKSADSEQFLFVLFDSSALFELFRFLFIVCQHSVVFPHTKQTGERLKREVCFENNNREREREDERARAFLVGAFEPRSALFERLPSSLSRLFSPQNKLVDTTER